MLFCEYRKAGLAFSDMTDRQRREAMACYYGTITEIDQTYGRLIQLVEQAGALDNTIVILTSDHGELLGAHGLYCKNFSGFEEVYNIPMVVAGPGIARGQVSDARVGLHDLAPTILELVGANPIGSPDSRSFAPLLANPDTRDDEFSTGYAEYHGGRYRLTQRIYWDGPWKLLFNGFDFDELYNVQDDPYEMNSLVADPAYQDRLRGMMQAVWRKVRETGDHPLWNSHYAGLRAAPFGPLIAEEPT